ncbi:YceI family protein [Pseudobacteriovorax antillogorgiicola]|uniref:YceI family protein n=1 Tax=Pseudobacteriovorax antillogorgiicola TaxID=1513793 RepID=UPI002E124EBD
MFLVACICSSDALAGDQIFRADQHCVAWQAHKTMFLFKTFDPVGMNCDISAKFEPSEEGLSLVVEVPLQSFDSGEETRDADVFEILQGEVQDPMIFKSTAAPDELWHQIVKLGRGIVPGKLKIGDQEFKVDCPVELSRSGDILILSGKLETHFTSFKIDPPTVLAGALVSVDDALKLHYRLRSDKIGGSDFLSK